MLIAEWSIVVVVSGVCLSKGPRNGGCTSRLGLLLVEVLHRRYPSSLLSILSAREMPETTSAYRWFLILFLSFLWRHC
jgi:hypothetical protein